MRRISMLSLAGSVVLALVLVPGLSSAGVTGTLTINPTSGVQGPDIPVTVDLTECFTEVDTIVTGTLLSPDGEQIGTYTAAPGGVGWVGNVTVPGDGPLGTYHVTGQCFTVFDVPEGGSEPAGEVLEPWFDYTPAPFVLTAAPDDPDPDDPEPEEPEPDDPEPKEEEEEPEDEVEAERETAPPATPVEAQPALTG